MDEVLAELERLGRQQPEGFARVDIEDALGVGEAAANERLRRWNRKGLIEFAGRRESEGRDGRRTWVPLYRLKQ